MHEDKSEQSTTLHTGPLLQTNTSYRAIWLWLSSIVVALVVILFLPWQQNVQGKGKVTALDPQSRPQSIPSRIDGRIDRWLVAEGTFVKAGTTIVEISEVKDEYLDPQLLARTTEQLTAKEQANRDKGRKAEALDQQILALQRARQIKLEQTRNKVVQYGAAVQQAVVEDSLARDQLRRREALYASPLGLVSLTDVQAAQLRMQSALAKLVEKRNELQNAKVDLDGVDAEYGEKIEKARADRQSTLADVQDGVGEVSKLRNKMASLTVRRGYYHIDAPQDGYVVKAIKQGVGEMVKAGDAIVTVQPAFGQRAVELYVRPVDVPLLHRGRRVRLQFDGWPALQFAGWPSVSVGTFGGEVMVIDQVASADGTFRVLVTPDAKDEAWPAQLRIGSGVYGWAALDTVRVWFELWRQLNGFPPSIAAPDAQATPKGDKK